MLFRSDAYTFSSTCVDINHVEEIKELKAQVTSLKKDLEKSHEGMSTLNNVLCGKNPQLAKVDLVSSLTRRTSPKASRRRAKNKSRIRPRLFASSAKLKGTMLDLAH